MKKTPGVSTTSSVPLSRLQALYAEHGSCRKVAKLVGLATQTVHERLKKVNGTKPINVFSKAEYKRLERDYLVYRDAGKLQDLASQMGRTKQFICRKAKELGLTDYRHKRVYISTWKYMPEDVARAIFEKFKHSKSTLGKFCARHGYDDLGFSRTMKGYFPDEWDAVIEAKAPKQTKYRVGREFEYRTRDALRKLGYFVLRSPRSGSPVDLIAVKLGKIVFVQCKLRGDFPVAEWNEFYDLCLSVGAEPVMTASPTGRGVEYFLLLGRKDGSKRRQPMRAWEP